MPKLGHHVNGRCFESAGRSVLDGALPELILCHGKVVGTTGDVEGKTFAHAWTEVGDYIIDLELNTVTPRERYYEIGQVHDVKKYTADQVASIVGRRRHWGPWPDEREGGSDEHEHSNRSHPAP